MVLKRLIAIVGLMCLALMTWGEPGKPADKKLATPSSGGAAPLSEPQTITPKSFVAVGKAVSPAVVNISVIVEKDGRRGQGAGTGFIVDKKAGYVMTNAHVVNGAVEGGITVVLIDKRELAVKVIGIDEAADVAVIQITSPPADLVQAALGDSNKLEVGDWVVAIGNPSGLGHTLTTGVVSALREMEKDEDPIMELESKIQTDTAINPGNSGGPLINLRGEVIGINTSILSRSGGNQGLGFSIPINRARVLMNVLIKDGKVIRPYLGVAPSDITERLAKYYNYENRDAFLKALGLEKPVGVFISGVSPDSPAQKAGLKDGDIIIEIGKIKVESERQMARALGKLKDKIDSEIDMKVIRDSKEQTVSLKLEGK